jgi:tetratricopeptide (TPR) repeat protein
MKSSLLSVILGSYLCLFGSAQAQTNHPTTEQFIGALSACVASKNLDVSADVLGSIKGAYEKATQGRLVFKSPTEFLSLFPESERKDAYRIYVECLTKLLGSAVPPFSPEQAQTCTATLTVCKDDFKISASAAINSCNRYLECDKKNPVVYSILGQAYRSAGQLSDSDMSFEKELQIGQQLNDPSTIGQAYNSLAINYVANNILDRADVYVRKSMAINLSSNRTMLAANYKVMADIYFKRGNFNSAEDYFQRAIVIQKEVDDKNGLGNTFIGLGYTRLRMGDRITGCSYLRQAYDVFSTEGIRRMQNQVQEHLQRTHC